MGLCRKIERVTCQSYLCRHVAIRSCRAGVPACDEIALVGHGDRGKGGRGGERRGGAEPTGTVFMSCSFELFSAVSHQFRCCLKVPPLSSKMFSYFAIVDFTLYKLQTVCRV